jgi:hypothetical protein
MKKPFRKSIHFKRAFSMRDIHVIFTRFPHVKSQASLFMLNDFYQQQEESPKFKWFRQPGYKEAIKEQVIAALQAKGEITCAYCGVPLTVETSVTTKAQKRKGTYLTLDHFIPICQGGKIDDPNNLVPSCEDCNTAKATSIGIVLPDGRLSWTERDNSLTKRR